MRPQERKAAVIRAEGESESAKLISDATKQVREQSKFLKFLAHILQRLRFIWQGMRELTPGRQAALRISWAAPACLPRLVPCSGAAFTCLLRPSRSRRLPTRRRATA